MSEAPTNTRILSFSFHRNQKVHRGPQISRRQHYHLPITCNMQSWLAQATQKSIGTVARRAQQQALPAARPRTFVTIANTTFRRQRLPTALVLCTQEGKKGAIVSFARQQQQQQRYLETEAEFHPIADQTLETIQDAMDAVFDGQPAIEYEVSLANGVLNLSLPPHGTWVINKQSPNRQIWVRDNINL